MKKDLINGLEFYFEMNKLKTLIRQGAVMWKVKTPRFESDAEHIALTETLAIALANQLGLDKKMNMQYLLTMINFHEIGELKLGDLTLYDKITPDEKHKQELEYAKSLLKKLKHHEKFVNMIKDFNKQTSLEAKFAKACDKLENVLEFKKYTDLNYTDLNKGSLKMLNEPRVKEILQANKGASMGKLWYLYHLPSFSWLGFTENDYENLLTKIKIKAQK